MRILSLITRSSARKIIAVTALFMAMGASAADVEKGKAKAATCIGCHGVNGISAIPTYPNLAGQKAGYTDSQLKAFRDGVRKNPTMKAMTSSLSDDDIANLAAYYASLKP